MSKPTLSTLKSFIRKNEHRLFISVKSSFDGMVDGVMPSADDSFMPITRRETQHKYTLGLSGVWLVGGSRDHIKPYAEGNFTGFEVSNCCGKFILAIRELPATERPGDAPAIMREETGIDYATCLVMCNCD